MPTSLVPGSNLGSELALIGVIIAAMAYGLVLTLYTTTFRALLDNLRKDSKRERNFLLAYITMMLLISTADLLVKIFAIIDEIFLVDVLNGQYKTLGVAWISPFSMWGADAFMMWRCMVLYQGSSILSRAALICVIVILFLLILVSEWANFIFPKTFNLADNAMLLAILGFSVLLNMTLSALISLRILHYQRRVRSALGTMYVSIYTRITSMCVESCAMIVVFELACLITIALPPDGQDATIPLRLISHICTISSTLIIYRVAKGTDASNTFDVTGVSSNGITSASTHIQFAVPTSTRVTQEAQLSITD